MIKLEGILLKSVNRLRYGKPVERHFPCSLISRQTMTVSDHQYGTLHFASDYQTPLYETIAEIIGYDCYRLRKMSQIRTAIDVGANIGVTSIVLSKGFSAQVIAVEPLNENVVQLRENLALNMVAGVSVVEAAVASKSGQVSIFPVTGFSVAARLADVGTAPSFSLSPVARSVSALTLGECLSRHGLDTVDFVKIDCEGAEFQIIGALDRELASRIRSISLEVHKDFSFGGAYRITQQLRALGYIVEAAPEMTKRRNLLHLFATRPC